MIDGTHRPTLPGFGECRTGLLKVVGRPDLMILFGLVALDQVPWRHFFIVSASCETTRMGMGLIKPKLAVRPGRLR
jgi:hypothetical protein